MASSKPRSKRSITNIVLVAFAVFAFVAYASHGVGVGVFNGASTCNPDTGSCEVQLSYAGMVAVTWIVFLMIRRAAIGQNLFIADAGARSTIVEAFVGGLVWASFSVAHDVVRKLRRDKSLGVGTWRGLTFNL